VSHDSSASGTDGFTEAVNQIREQVFRPEIQVREIPAPEAIAPRSFALSGDVFAAETDLDSPYGTGRFILLHDPDSSESWGADFRIVCFAQAPLEVEIGEDALLAEVTWSWLMDGLERRNAAFTSPAGTATKTLSTGFGSLHGQGSGAQIELRASWTPIGDDFGAHAQGWAELLCLLAGLPEHADGVTSLKERKVTRESPSR